MAREVVNVEGLEEVKRRLEALPAEFASKNGGPVRVGLRKGALVIRNAARANVARIVAEPNVGGGDESTGLLEKSITVKRGRALRNGKGERVFVLVSKRARYPIEPRTPSGIGVEQVGRMLEYGTSRRRAMPWMGPAFHATREEAVRVVVAEVGNAITRIERKLAKGTP